MSTTTELKPEFDSLGIARNWQVTVEVDAERVLCISNQHYAGKIDLEPYEATIESCAKHLLAFIGRSAAHGESKVPQFIVRDVERAIDATTNQKGMHTNGPAMARIEASRLAALLRYAQINSSAPAQAGSADRIAKLERMAATGTVESFMTLPEQDKRLAYALLVEESSRRKKAEQTLEELREQMAGSAESERDAFEKWFLWSEFKEDMRDAAWEIWQSALSAQGQQSEDAKDAERYRYLRSIGGKSWTVVETQSPAMNEFYDAGVDAAMSTTPSEKP